MKKLSPRTLIRSLAARYAFPREKHCIFCARNGYSFLPYGEGLSSQSSFFAAMDIVGSDVENFACAWCGSTDRERHLWMYFQATDLVDDFSSSSILHFAPETQLSKKILSAGPARYVKADLYPTHEDIESIDMLAIAFESDSFDFVIANHVLEHVEDDQQAAAEIFRVLKPEGLAILQTPYSNRLHSTWYDPGIDTDEGRLIAYGQEDHLRLFGRDIFNRISRSGLVADIHEHSIIPSHYSPGTHGINPAEPFFLYRKPNRSCTVET